MDVNALKRLQLICLLFIVSASLGCGGPPSENEKVMDVAQKYAQISMDPKLGYSGYGEIYGMFSTDARPIIFESWASRKEAIKEQQTRDIVSLEFLRAENPQINGSTATVEIIYNRNTKGFNQKTSRTITLTKEDEIWKLAEDVDF